MGDFILPMKISTYNHLTETSTTTTITNTNTNPFKRTKFRSLKMVFSKQKNTILQNLFERVIRPLLTVTVSTSSSSDGSLCRRCQEVIVVVEETNYRDVFSDGEKVINQIVSSPRLFFDGEREEVFWKKKILMGRRCRPLDFEEEEVYGSMGYSGGGGDLLSELVYSLGEDLVS